jgi:Protein of unknown function (DUF2505)
VPRSFDISADSPAGAGQVHSAFSDEGYWLARLADSGDEVATLDSLIVDADGTVTVTFTQGVRRGQLPGLVSRVPGLAALFNRGGVKAVRIETWRRIGSDRLAAEVSVVVPGAPISLAGKVMLIPASTGSRVRFSGSVVVKVPLVGGRIEGIIGDGLSNLVVEEQRFTAAWIAGNARRPDR